MSMEEREMNIYRIESRDGTVFGDYQGATPEDAFWSMVADGNGDAETAGTPDDWIITPVDMQEVSV